MDDTKAKDAQSSFEETLIPLGSSNKRTPQAAQTEEEEKDEEQRQPDANRDPTEGDFIDVSGNISNAVVVPPDFVGSEPQKGHLIFNADFESGNLGKVVCLWDSEFDLYIRPDTCNSKYRVWFYFTVKNVKRMQRVIFNIVNYSKTKTLFREGMSPVVCSTSRPKWERIPSKNVFYYRCPRHGDQYVMSFLFAFDNDQDKYCFSYCYPYSYSDLQAYLGQLDARRTNYYRRELLGCSLQLRKVDLITITNPKNLVKGREKKIIFISSRIHPGETPSSYVCQGMIDFLMSCTPEAKLLRDNLVFKFVPMLNPDGVYHGNYRCSFMGFDLNRHWQKPTSWTQPTLVATKAKLMEFNSDSDVSVEFYIDIHAHTALTNVFMYGNEYSDTRKKSEHVQFPQLLSKNIKEFSIENSSFNRDKVKAGTGRRFLGQFLGPNSHSYTLEVSFFSFMNGEGEPRAFSIDDYLRLGRNIALTFIDYYNLLEQ
eukprot:Nk52_evm12s294 gene=Nk52_evmTU12s294